MVEGDNSSLTFEVSPKNKTYAPDKFFTRFCPCFFFNFFRIYFGSLIIFFRVKTLLDLVSDLPDEVMATVLRKEL